MRRGDAMTKKVTRYQSNRGELFEDEALALDDDKTLRLEMAILDACGPMIGHDRTTVAAAQTIAVRLRLNPDMMENLRDALNVILEK